MGLCLTGNTPLDGGLVNTIDAQPREHAPNSDCPECVTSQWAGVKARKKKTVHTLGLRNILLSYQRYV